MVQKRNSIGVLAIGILIGSVVGTSVALLAAPQSGEKTRSMLREKGVELKSRASTTVQETRVKAEDVVSKVRTRAEELASRINMRADHMSQPTEILAE
jgi:gas vesicle protein